MQAIGQNGGFPFSASNSGEANSRTFPGQVEYFFFTCGASFLLQIHYPMKTLQLCVKSIYFKGRFTENKTGFRCSVLLAKNIYKV